MMWNVNNVYSNISRPWHIMLKIFPIMLYIYASLLTKMANNAHFRMANAVNE